MSADLRVHRVDPAAARRAAAQLGRAVAVDLVLQAAGLSVGFPFVMGTNGYFPVELNRWLRALPGMNVRSVESVRKYARELIVFERWLNARGIGLWEASEDDLRQYKSLRLRNVGKSAVNTGVRRHRG